MTIRGGEIIVDKAAIASRAAFPASLYRTDVLMILLVANRLLLRVIAIGVSVAAIWRSGHCRTNGSLSLIKLGFIFFRLLRLTNIKKAFSITEASRQSKHENWLLVDQSIIFTSWSLSVRIRNVSLRD